MRANPEREAEARRRRERLAASLRENLKRRKALSRGRASADEEAGRDDARAAEGRGHGSDQDSRRR